MPVISLPESHGRSFGFLRGISRPLPPIVVPLLLAFGTFAPSFANEFVYDDQYIIVENEALHSLQNFAEIITGSWWPDALYRPFTQLTFAFDWAIGQGSPVVFHFMNVAFHVFCTLLVFRLARRMLPVASAIVASSLFAVHPVHVEAVANVVGRAEVLATFFVLGAALLYLADGDLASRGINSGRRWATSVGVMAFSVLAYASKESALALPGILLILDWLVARQNDRPFEDVLRQHWVLLLGTLVLGLEWLVVRANVLGDLAGDHPGPGVFGEDFFGRFTAMSPVVLEWVRLLVFPFHLSADYSPAYLPGGWNWRGIVGLLVVIGLIVVAVRNRRSRPIVTFALAWLGGSLLIVSNLIVPSGVLLAERSLYLPSVGFCLLLGFLVSKGGVQRNLLVGIVSVVVGLGVARSIERVSVWKNPTTFFPRLVVDARGSFRSYWVAGAIAYQQGDRETGEQLMRAAIDVYPIFPNVWNSLATEFESEERWSEAGDFFLAAYRIDRTRLNDAVSAMSNYIRGERYDRAVSVARTALADGSSDYRLLVLLADVALAREEPLRAMTYRRQVAFRLSDVWQYWYLTAEAAVLADYCPEASRSLERVEALNPGFTDELDVVVRYATMSCE